MVSAPTPGKARREKDAGRVISITYDGETIQLMPAALTFEDRATIRKQTGLPFEAYASAESSIGEDTLALWWWLALRQSGRPRLSWHQFEFEWADIDFMAAEIEVTEDDAQEPTDLPEGSGPGSETPSLA